MLRSLYTRYPTVARALGLAALRPSAREQRCLTYNLKACPVLYVGSSSCYHYTYLWFTKIIIN